VALKSQATYWPGTSKKLRWNQAMFSEVIDWAESYLQFQAFSRTGLIKQLEFEKFATEDATWAVDHVKVDWMEQAAKKAKSYLEHQAFSHDSLVQQLAFEGFTPEEAEHGTTADGL
jgi:hypothetical protein